MDGRLFGRLEPTDYYHQTKYPFKKLGISTVSFVDKELKIFPGSAEQYYQYKNSCVGSGISYAASILNRRLYDPLWAYYETTKIDGDPNTSPEADIGTYLDPAFSLWRKVGHKEVDKKKPSLYNGIYAYYWASSVNEIRTAISIGRPVVLGINWYESFEPHLVDNEWWIVSSSSSDLIVGGHCVCCYAASDRLQGLKIASSWKGFPDVWIGYGTMRTLMLEGGEAGIPLDIKPNPLLEHIRFRTWIKRLRR